MEVLPRLCEDDSEGADAVGDVAAALLRRYHMFIRDTVLAVQAGMIFCGGA